MNTYIVIGTNGESFTIVAENYNHQPDNKRVVFKKGMMNIAIFQTDNIIGFYMVE